MRDMITKIKEAEDPLEVIDVNTRPWTGSPDTRIRIDQVLSPIAPHPGSWEMTGDRKMLFGFTKAQYDTMLRVLQEARSDTTNTDKSRDAIDSVIETLTGVPRDKESE